MVKMKTYKQLGEEARRDGRRAPWFRPTYFTKEQVLAALTNNRTNIEVCKELGLALWRIQDKIDRKRYEFRHRHIAYCQLRGRERTAIEVPAENNLPNEKYIERIMAEHAEDVCAGAERSA